MTDDDQRASGAQGPEKRRMVRYLAKAQTLIIRDSDVMRSGLNAQLRDLSVAGLGITIDTPLEVNEQVKLMLTNEIQRVKKETRGTVRHVTSLPDGNYLVGIELTARLTPLEVSLLKLAIPESGAGGENTWV